MVLDGACRAFDALYQTAITVSTVGYGDVGPDDEVDRAYRAFTLILVPAGATSVTYTEQLARLGAVVAPGAG